ncbi:unnamed protein product [Mesocestoides corti]|uniref:YEATS domain-containing protein n=1 Tax=Mesocestoides corti TaxID=53468 RepID=A0A3P6HJR5_MESCO|nr:unnamed protein product [Mesocestoides corti]
MFVFKVGHSVYRKRNPTPEKTHHWRFYVDSWSKRYPLSTFVNSVVFHLHETFKNPRQVVIKEPFAIEEDGFGSFCLRAQVYFLNVFADLTYDLTLFDRRELHAFRTVRIDPKDSEDWILYTNVGGIPVPTTASIQDIQQRVLDLIQMSSKNGNLTISSFYPELSEAILATAVRCSSQTHSPVPLRNRLGRESRSQALANLGMPITPSSTPTSSLTAPLSLTSASTSHLPSQLPSSIKHKKKLQLKHEAQLRFENQHLSEVSNSRPHTSQHLDPLAQKERIVIKLSRSELKKGEEKVKKIKKKHKRHHHHHHRSETRSTSGSQSDATPYTHANAVTLIQSPSHAQSSPVTAFGKIDASGDRGKRLCKPTDGLFPALSNQHPACNEEDGAAASSSSPVSRSIFGSLEEPVNGSGNTKRTSGDGFHDQMRNPAEAAGSPHLDPQHATMVWISHLTGGPQPLVSPLPPHPTSPKSVLSPHPSVPPAQEPSVLNKPPTEGNYCLQNREQNNFKEITPPSAISHSFIKHTSSPCGYGAVSTKALKRKSDEDRGVISKSRMEEPISVTKRSHDESPTENMKNKMQNPQMDQQSSQEPSSHPSLSPDSTPPMSAEAASDPSVVVPNTNTTGVFTSAADGAYLDDAALESLFDRLLCLENECMAIHMAEVLKRYANVGDDAIDVLTPEGAEYDCPQIIAFNLRKLPLECLVELTEIITADERMSAERDAAASAATDSTNE